MRGENHQAGEGSERLIFSHEGKIIRIRFSWSNVKNLYIPKQKHTSRAYLLLKFPSPIVVADAVVTRLKGVEVGVLTADCAPVVFVGKETVGVAHAGWRGLRSGIIQNTLSIIRRFESLKDLFVFVGPCAKGCCYEVGPEFEEIFPKFVFRREGKLYMDLQNAVIDTLKNCGVSNLGLLEECTVCSKTYPSYRRDKTQERFLTSVEILPQEPPHSVPSS